ncbi:MAG TPA: hypothetical protein VK835_04650 [Bacteroidia bacterium]|jgi:hypothetical protein|nr:hypothetical protein [Bacteroidia bacterium]
MKKNKLVIVLLVALIAVAIFVMIKNKRKTLVGNDDDFAVPDTASVDKLFLANKKGATALLEKNDKGVWMINGKYPARTDAVELLLVTFMRTQIKFPAPQNSQENLLREIASKGTKCEIYQNGKLSKTWYVGHETQDLRGTYCLLQGADNEKPFDKVYAIEIPGFIGTIVPRFFLTEAEWREKKVLSLTPDKIKNVTLTLPDYPDTSFIINIYGLHKFDVTTLSGKKIQPFDTAAVQQYLSYFMNLYVEYWCTNSFLPEIDSVRKTSDFVQISITDINNQKDTYKFYHKPVMKDKSEDEKGNKLPYDPENMYMKFRGDAEFARVSAYGWGKLFQTSRYFAPKRSVKK